MYIPFEGHLNKLQRIYLGKDELYFPLLRYDRFEILVSTKENSYFTKIEIYPQGFSQKLVSDELCNGNSVKISSKSDRNPSIYVGRHNFHGNGINTL